MNAEENKEKITETALRLFNTRGCRGVTMDNIAQAEHMSKRTLYEIFSNKEELITECLRYIAEQNKEMHRRVNEKVGEPMLIGLYMLQSNALFSHKYNIFIEETRQYYPEIHNRFFCIRSEEIRKKVSSAMDYATEHHYLREDVDKEVAIDFLCMLAHGHNEARTNTMEEFFRRLNEVYFTYIRGLMTIEAIARYEKEAENYRNLIETISRDF